MITLKLIGKAAAIAALLCKRNNCEDIPPRYAQAEAEKLLCSKNYKELYELVDNDQQQIKKIKTILGADYELF